MNSNRQGPKKTTHYQSYKSLNQKKDEFIAGTQTSASDVETTPVEKNLGTSETVYGSILSRDYPVVPEAPSIKEGKILNAQTKVDSVTGNTRRTYLNIGGQQYKILHELGAVSSKKLMERTGIEKRGDATLGRGNFGTVRIAKVKTQNKSEYQYRAIKEVIKPKDIEEVIHEQKVHDYVKEQQKQGKLLGLMTVSETAIFTMPDNKKTICQVMPLGNFGDGNALIKALANPALDTNDKADLLRYAALSLTKTFAEMQDATNPMYHRDFKPDNFLMTLDGDIKIADLGATCVRDSSDRDVVSAGSALANTLYYPPEILSAVSVSENDANEKIDNWRLGLTLLQLACPSEAALQFVYQPGTFTPVPNFFTDKILRTAGWHVKTPADQQIA